MGISEFKYNPIEIRQFRSPVILVPDQNQFLPFLPVTKSERSCPDRRFFETFVPHHSYVGRRDNLTEKGEPVKEDAVRICGNHIDGEFIYDFYLLDGIDHMGGWRF